MITSELRYAARSLMHRRGVALAVVTTLSLGVGLNVAAFCVVNGLLLKGPPYPDSAAIVQVQRMSNVAALEWDVPGADFERWRSLGQPFQSSAGYRAKDVTIGATESGREVRAVEATAGLFDVLQVAPALGRTFGVQEEKPGADRVVVISARFWRSQYGGSSDAIGASLRVDGNPYQVIGVMPAQFVFPDEASDLCFPFYPGMTMTTTDGGGRAVSVPQFPVIGRLRAGTSRAQAEAKINEGRSRQNTPLVLVSWHDALTRPVRSLVLLLQMSVALVLLIACANIASLLLAEGSGRAREFATRLAIGAGRWQLVRQLLAEALIVSLVAAAAAIAIGHAAVRVMQIVAGREAPQIQAIGLDPAVLAFATLLSLAAGLGAAIVPALRATRVDPVIGLKAQGSVASSMRSRLGSRFSGGRAFVGVQLVVAVVLLSVAVSLIASFVESIQKRPAYADRHLITSELRFLGDASRTFTARQALIADVLQLAGTLPSTGGAAVTTTVPLPLGVSYFDLSGQSRDTGDVSISDAGVLRYVTVSAQYFSVMGIRLVRGRYLLPTDTLTGRPVVIVSRAFGEERFGGRDPLGQTVSFLRRDWEIVGVVDDVREPRSGRRVSLVYCNFQQLGYPGTSWDRRLTSFTIVLKARSDPETVFAAFQARLRTLGPNFLVSPPVSMEARLLRSMGPLNFYGAVMTALAIVALGLAGLGVFALMSRSVAKRSREIGVRLALGAEPSGIFRMIMWDGMILGTAGLLVGLPLSFAAHNVVRATVFGLRPFDVWWVLVSAGMLEAVLVLACALPARRACRFHPVECLRADG